MIDLSKINRDKLVHDLTEAIMRIFQEDEQGRLWVVDKNGNRIDQIEIIDDRPSVRHSDERKTIEEASKMSLQKKEERLVINLPAWLKDRLKNRAKRTGQSMNEIIRLALTEYLAK